MIVLKHCYIHIDIYIWEHPKQKTNTLKISVLNSKEDKGAKICIPVPSLIFKIIQAMKMLISLSLFNSTFTYG